MNRINLSQMTSNRLGSAIRRRIMDIPDWFSWRMPFSESRRSKEQLLRFAGLYAGKRCFIIGNGPSLAGMDLSLLKDEITFGTNRIYLIFDKFEFKPTYYVCMNELVLEQFSHEIKQLEMLKFINWNCKYLFDKENSYILPVRVSLSVFDDFAPNPYNPFSSGGTVTYVALQLAYLMGFSEVILIGVDHFYVDQGTPNKVEVRTAEKDLNHFHPGYFPKGIKWQLPDLLRSELAYELARQRFEKDGRKILDATVNGKCTVFEKIDYLSLFSQ